VRNALILLAVIAAIILTAGALNHGVAFDVDYVTGTVNAVSLFWVAAVVAAVLFVSGVAAAWLARATTVTSRRKLEAELRSTYERLREAEALAAGPRVAAEPATLTAVMPEERTATTTSQTAVTEIVDEPSDEPTKTRDDTLEDASAEKPAQDSTASDDGDAETSSDDLAGEASSGVPAGPASSDDDVLT
jgi:hypothetical protein